MDDQQSLFPLPEMVSPMEEWRKRHWVSVYPVQDGFRANTTAANGYGKTREAALLDWADRAKVKCWKAEELERNSHPPKD